MVEGMTNDGWTSVIQIQAMPLKVGNVSLFSCFIVGRPFSFLFVWPYFSDKSLSIPKTQDVRIGKAIHCYPVRMRNSPSVVWLDRIGNMALVVQVLHRRRFLSDWKAVLSAGLGRHLLVPFRFVGRSHFPVDCGSFGPSKIMGTAISNPGRCFCCSCCRTELHSSVCGGLCISSRIWASGKLERPWAIGYFKFPETLLCFQDSWKTLDALFQFFGFLGLEKFLAIL